MIVEDSGHYISVMWKLWGDYFSPNPTTTDRIDKSITSGQVLYLGGRLFWVILTNLGGTM